MKLDYLDAVSISEINFNKSLRLAKELSTRILQNAALSYVKMEEEVTTLEVFDENRQLLSHVNPNL